MSDRFGFMQPSHLLNERNDERIKKQIQNFSLLYGEVMPESLIEEVKRLRRLMHSFQIDRQRITQDDPRNWDVLQLLKWIVKWALVESLPNLTISLRICLTICVSVASCERSFSKLKLIKTYLRSTMSQTRLSNLAILSIEREVAEEMDTEQIIHDFSVMKVRKM
ncbi:uncharacterized protein LOC119598865 [Penaeus monodon]|uniref:uncharacterized protein LOC119598865 n=1 Tax=Penaeus monodon TaxID=6687 RepID=UPI0018A7113C|nr:uncharacterized protein LOC119598865 [Penaeus monodon]